MSTAQDRIRLVFDRINVQIQDNDELADTYATFLDEMLSCMMEEGQFGDDGQDDPRGNQQTGSWDMTYVEGID